MCLSTFTDNFVYAMGVSGAVVGVLSFAIVADTASPEKRGEYMPFVSTSNTCGMISGPVIGGLLFDHFGAHGAFAFPAFMLLCDIILRIMIIEKGNQERLTVVRPIHVLKIVANLLIDQDEPLSPLAGEEATSLPPKDYNQASLRLREFYDVRFLTAVITQITISSIFAALETTIPIFTMETYNWSSTNAGPIFLGISLPSFLSIPMSRYGRNWRRRRTIHSGSTIFPSIFDKL
ncbi:hypothetical protein N7520_008881 [Penicillium odoratum]|uniref:uncharacterized protein n=1 Tax=Penicillium odoratum TaxID=1167516 RepID=UPI002549923D|nr:uncharacterized protein N7520_008881 [Penicillium odoratum]KAJ5751964.1 hypothetical protein N7520_008881 [Penicillium odoratum]